MENYDSFPARYLVLTILWSVGAAKRRPEGAPARPGHDLHDFLHQFERVFGACAAAMEASTSDTLDGDADHLLLLLNAALVDQRESQFRPQIAKWHVELMEAANRLASLPESAPFIQRMDSALDTLFEAAAANEARADGASPAPPNPPPSTTAPMPGARAATAYVDTRLICAGLDALWSLADYLRQLWPHFDPAERRVHRAMAPWDRARDLVVENARDADVAIQTSEADSAERRDAVDQMVQQVERALPAEWKLCVRHALTADLGKELDTACRHVRNAARKVNEIAMHTPQNGDRAWTEQLGDLNDAITVMQDLDVVQRRAGAQERAEAWGAVATVRERVVVTKQGTQARIERLAKDAVRRAHQGYIDDEVFVAAVEGGLSYRKAAEVLSKSYSRTVTKRQVEGAVKRCGGIRRVRERSVDLPTRGKVS